MQIEAKEKSINSRDLRNEFHWLFIFPSFSFPMPLEACFSAKIRRWHYHTIPSFYWISHSRWRGAKRALNDFFLSFPLRFSFISSTMSFGGIFLTPASFPVVSFNEWKQFLQQSDELTFVSGLTWIIYFNELWWMREWWIVYIGRMFSNFSRPLNLTHEICLPVHKYCVWLFFSCQLGTAPNCFLMNWCDVVFYGAEWSFVDFIIGLWNWSCAVIFDLILDVFNLVVRVHFILDMMIFKFIFDGCLEYFLNIF